MTDYGQSPAQEALSLVRLLNQLQTLEFFSFEQAISEMGAKLGVPAHFLKRPPGRNYVLLKQYES